MKKTEKNFTLSSTFGIVVPIQALVKIRNNGDRMNVPQHLRYYMDYKHYSASIKDLTDQIEILRKQMTETALKTGFTSKESIEKSQELDKLLNMYQSIIDK